MREFLSTHPDHTCTSLYSNRTANACFKDAADLHAELEEYSQAIQRYEQVANHSLGSPLTKYSVKDYWLRSGLCAIAMSVSWSGWMSLPSLTII